MACNHDNRYHDLMCQVCYRDKIKRTENNEERYKETIRGYSKELISLREQVKDLKIALAVYNPERVEEPLPQGQRWTVD